MVPIEEEIKREIEESRTIKLLRYMKNIPTIGAALLLFPPLRRLICYLVQKKYPTLSEETLNNLNDNMLSISFIILILSAYCAYKAIRKRIGKLDKIDKLVTRMDTFKITLDSVCEVVNTVKAKSLRLIDITCSILADITHLNIKKEIVEKEENRELVAEGLEALKINLEAWSTHINETSDQFIQKNWLNYLRTYFREEAFDIQHKELVTNARNYPFLLITTLLSFVDTIASETNFSGKKVYFYTVTPVHPKDWYNWPHGYGKKSYFEQNFIGLYRRILREILRWDKKKIICHGRFLITASDKGDEFRKKFIWIDKYDRVISRLPNWWILDIPFSKDQIASVLRYLGKNDIAEIYEKYDDFPSNQDKKFILLFNSAKWKTPSSNVIEQVKKQIDEAKKSICQNFRNNLELNNANANETVKRAIEEVICYCRTYCDACNDNECPLKSNGYKKVKTDFTAFIKNIQYLSMVFSTQHDMQEKLDGILTGLLRLYDFSDTNFQLLNNKFIEDLHTKDGQAAILAIDELTKDQYPGTGWRINQWIEKVPSEFAMFGIGTSDKNIDWKIVLMTDLDYPFKVAGIRLLTSDEKNDKDKKDFEKFKTIMNAYINSDFNEMKVNIRD